VNFSIEELRHMMDVQPNIRNMSVIAHVDHGILIFIVFVFLFSFIPYFFSFYHSSFMF